MLVMASKAMATYQHDQNKVERRKVVSTPTPNSCQILQSGRQKRKRKSEQDI